MQRVGRYVLGDCIGRGGMAEVYVGHALGDRGFRKPVAIKRVLPEAAAAAGDAQCAQRLIDEAKLVVGLSHGNVVSVIDLVCDAGDGVFVVMDYIDGPSVRQLMQLVKPLPIGIACYLVHEAAIGLEFAHRRGLIHADVSPSNLLCTRSGEVRVADFGIARRAGLGALGPAGVEGKWAYMAPEQARGEALTGAADVWALGVVLFELLAGRRPKKIAADITIGSVLRAELPRELMAICGRAFAEDPARRPSMREMAAMLDEARYAHGWREGAHELADLIASVHVAAPAAVVTPPPVIERTVVSDRVAPRSDLSVALAVLELEPKSIAVMSPVVPVAVPVRPSDLEIVLAAAVEPEVEAPQRGRLGSIVLACAALAAGVAAAWIGFHDEAPAEVAIASAPPIARTPWIELPPAPIPAPAAIVVEPPPAAPTPVVEPPPIAHTVAHARARVVAKPAIESPPVIESPPPPPPPKASTAQLDADGTAAYLAARLPEARAAFEAALAIDPDDASALRGAGIVYQRMGWDAKAIAALHHYLAVRPAARDAHAIADRIARMEGE